MAQCTLSKDFIAGMGPRAEHVQPAQLRSSWRASDAAFHGLQPAVRAELLSIQLVCIVIYTQTVPGSYRAMRGERVGRQETTRTVPMGTLEQIPAQRE